MGLKLEKGKHKEAFRVQVAIKRCDSLGQWRIASAAGGDVEQISCKAWCAVRSTYGIILTMVRMNDGYSRSFAADVGISLVGTMVWP